MIEMSLDEAKYILKWLRIEDTDVRQATNKVLEELDRMEKVTNTALKEVDRLKSENMLLKGFKPKNPN